MSAAKGKGLGKGLGALFDDIEVTMPVAEIRSTEKGTSSEEIIYIDIHEIKPNAKQPRKFFSEEAIEELANSITAHGVIQPVMVRQAKNGYELVAGERRWRAARKAGLAVIPALVRDISEEQNMLFALIENMQREDLNPIEEAEAMQQVMDIHGLTQEELAKSLGKSRPYIANLVRLLKLPEEIRDLMTEGKLSGGHGKAICAVKDREKQLRLAKYVVENGCSVREAEKLAVDPKFGKPTLAPVPRSKNHAILAIEEELRGILGTKVTINNQGNRGKIQLDYYSRDELEGLIELLRGLK